MEVTRLSRLVNRSKGCGIGEHNFPFNKVGCIFRAVCLIMSSSIRGKTHSETILNMLISSENSGKSRYHIF